MYICGIEAICLRRFCHSVCATVSMIIEKKQRDNVRYETSRLLNTFSVHYVGVCVCLCMLYNAYSALWSSIIATERQILNRLNSLLHQLSIIKLQKNELPARHPNVTDVHLHFDKMAIFDALRKPNWTVRMVFDQIEESCLHFVIISSWTTT